MSNSITVADAAKMMGTSKLFIRLGLQQNIFPWGYAVKVSDKRYTYYINAEKFKETELKK